MKNKVWVKTGARREQFWSLSFIFHIAGFMHTEVLWVAGEEQGAEKPGFGQDIKSGLSKPVRNQV